MRVVQRYFLFQVPGWVLAVLILYGLHRWLGLPAWIASLLLVAEIVKDFVLYPYLRKAYEQGETAGPERFAGQIAEVQQELAPEGYVRVKGELWRARMSEFDRPVPVGASVRIRRAQGMTLWVSAPTEDTRPDSARSSRRASPRT